MRVSVIQGSRINLSPEVKTILDKERERRKAKPKPAFVAAAGPIEPVQDVHISVEPTARALRKTKPDKDDIVRATGTNHCGIEVGSESVERTIIILNDLARGLEQSALKLEPVGTGMRVSISPDTVNLTLKERVERRAHTPTMEELAKEERLRKKRERESRLDVWSFSYERAYPEFDYIRTGELGLEIENQYVTGLRRSWRDGRCQRLELIVDDVVGGTITYLAGVKAQREEYERREREWRRREELRALAHARKEREERRGKFLEHLTASLTEAEELRSFLRRLQQDTPELSSGELVRFLEWAEARLRCLEDEFTAVKISATLQERKLFPEIDPLTTLPDQDEE